MILFILITFIIITILSYSGFGNQMHINDILLALFWIGFFYYITNKKTIRPTILGRLSLLVNPICIVLLINVLLNYKSNTQLVNYTTLFGIIIGTSLLSRINWLKGSLFKTGLIVWFFAWIMSNLFLPGRIMSGWNNNSTIGLIPAMMCGMGYIYLSNNSMKYIIICICLLLSITILLHLENRSSILSLLLFGLLSTPYILKRFSNISLFRIFYLTAIFINIGFPLFNEIIGQWDLYNDAVSISLEYATSKEDGFNGRDQLWKLALSILEQKPILGHGGVRGIYFHNFSCDVLTQFGWLGWFTFAIMYIRIMEACFVPNSRANIFLFAIGCILILNAFENALFANNYFSIYSYILLAIPLYIKNNTKTRYCLNI